MSASVPPVRDPEFWSFDIIGALHDEMKGGEPYRRWRSRVLVSRVEFPSWAKAAEVAACMAMCRHGGMAIEIWPRY